MIIIEKIVDVETGTEQIIEREETTAEKESRLKSEKKLQEQQILQVEQSAAKQALLEKLGITEEEAKLLLS